MSQYYLISQLPSLDAVSDDMMLPVTEERFIELCSRFVGKKALDEIKSLTLVPPENPENSSSSLVAAWNAGERNLRLALAKVRAEKLKKQFDTGNAVFSLEVMQAANTAADMDNPMSAEKFLDDYRLKFLESLRPMDTFCDDAVFYYGLKLKLLLRIRQFSESRGEAAYRNIYNSIMTGERLEVMQ